LEIFLLASVIKNKETGQRRMCSAAESWVKVDNGQDGGDLGAAFRGYDEELVLNLDCQGSYQMIVLGWYQF
jgi:hypothetical protein